MKYHAAVHPEPGCPLGQGQAKAALCVRYNSVLYYRYDISDMYCEAYMTAVALPADWPITHYIATLRRHRHTLAERYHVEALGVFGSYVRNEQHDGSDLDLLVTFTQTP